DGGDLRLIKIATEEGTEQRRCHLVKRLAGELGDGRCGKLGPAGGHIEAAVAREAGKQHVGKPQTGRLASGRDVAHAVPSFPDRRGLSLRPAEILCCWRTP